MAKNQVHFLVFDVESVADGELIAKLRYPDKRPSAKKAVASYRAELFEKYESDFIPYTFQLPISIAVAKIAPDFRLLDLVCLDEEEARPHVMTDLFWRGWRDYQQPTLVSFNGRTFDVPLLELAAFRYGLRLPRWYALAARSFDQPRNRYNVEAHLDLQELLTNFGATRFTGGLNLAANLIGKPGKTDVQGDMVQDLYEEGRIQEINDYCRCDVLDTYFVFLRSRVLVGELDLDEEQGIIAETKTWLTKRVDEVPAYASYLQNWGDWQNMWRDAD
ncbi:MAG: 3'-5' exonuclease [Planctomycetota bacterium]|nr:MAG: 3'-5' exonuclease [Planctomycetota bacterium]REK28216.1 MAG: 3'-5' exonuclease [Planctomycetota bacterium]REK39789.1 MAG: 3'-5' exonuclease [Planctomycetota bacterium]